MNYFEKFVSNPAFLDSAKQFLDDSSRILYNQILIILRRWAYLKNDFNRVISYAGSSGDALERLKIPSNQDAWTAYRIGEAYFSSGQLAKAEVFFQRSVELEPIIWSSEIN